MHKVSFVRGILCRLRSSVLDIRHVASMKSILEIKLLTYPSRLNCQDKWDGNFTMEMVDADALFSLCATEMSIEPTIPAPEPTAPVVELSLIHI